MRKLFVAIVALFLYIPATMAQQDTLRNDAVPDYSKALERLLEVSGAKTSLSKMYPALMETMKESLSDVPYDVYVRLEYKMRKFFFKEIINLYTPIYMRYMTIDEVKGLADFYDSPLGRKVAMTMPSLTADLYEAGKTVGKRITEEVFEELAKEGYKPKDL